MGRDTTRNDSAFVKDVSTSASQFVCAFSTADGSVPVALADGNHHAGDAQRLGALCDGREEQPIVYPETGQLVTPQGWRCVEDVLWSLGELIDLSPDSYGVDCQYCRYLLDEWQQLPWWQQRQIRQRLGVSQRWLSRCLRQSAASVALE